jgi:hypothetical protein
MLFDNYFISLNENSNINLISSYKNIRIKFILLYIEKKYISNNKEFFIDSLIYSKYYLYWKIYGCVYSDEIMNILYDIEYIK